LKQQRLQLLQQQSSATLKKNDASGQRLRLNSYRSARDCALANATLPVPPPLPGTGHSIVACGEEHEQEQRVYVWRYSSTNNNILTLRSLLPVVLFPKKSVLTNFLTLYVCSDLKCDISFGFTSLLPHNMEIWTFTRYANLSFMKNPKIPSIIK
jgi:hypothetical protein